MDPESQMLFEAMRRHASGRPLEPRDEYAPEIGNIGALTFMSSLPGGTQAAALAQALGARVRGDAKDLRVSYDQHRRRNDEALQQFGSEASTPWRAASLIPALLLGRAGQAAWAGGAAATRGAGPVEAGLEVLANAMHSPGPSGPVMAGPIVYHGSPYVFDRFSMQKLGSGEGKQLPELIGDHGWGGYFAKTPQAAERYRREISMNAMTLDGKAENALSPAEADVLMAVGAEVGRGHLVPTALKRAQAWLRSVARTNPRAYSEASRIANNLTPDRFSGTGRLYEMNVPDDLMSMADSVAMQSPAVKERVTSAGFPETMTGEEVYTSLTKRLGSKRAASRFLADLGVPGHTYRTASAENVVMYDDVAIEPVGRYSNLDDLTDAMRRRKGGTQ